LRDVAAFELIEHQNRQALSLLIEKVSALEGQKKSDDKEVMDIKRQIWVLRGMLDHKLN
jgi:hypothetical protein